jgi:hypothetical protein
VTKNKEKAMRIKWTTLYVDDQEKALQFFQLSGYLRFRAYLFHALNLGIFEGTTGPKSPPLVVFSFETFGISVASFVWALAPDYVRGERPS